MVSGIITTQIIMTLSQEDVQELLNEFQQLRKQGIKFDPNDIRGKRTGFKSLNHIYSLALHAQLNESQDKIDEKELEYISADLEYLKRRILVIGEKVETICRRKKV